jgi:hypothetical protein
MYFKTLPLLSCVSVFFALSACTPRKIEITQATHAFQTQRYMVVQTSPDRFLVLTKSNTAIGEIQKQLGCGTQHICSGEWNGEMWTIERLK